MNNGLLRKIDAVTIQVPDLDTGLAFYSETLGHELRWRNDSVGQAGLRVPDSDTEIVLTPNTATNRTGSWNPPATSSCWSTSPKGDTQPTTQVTSPKLCPTREQRRTPQVVERSNSGPGPVPRIGAKHPQQRDEVRFVGVFGGVVMEAPDRVRLCRHGVRSAAALPRLASQSERPTQHDEVDRLSNRCRAIL